MEKLRCSENGKETGEEETGREEDRAREAGPRQVWRESVKKKKKQARGNFTANRPQNPSKQ